MELWPPRNLEEHHFFQLWTASQQPLNISSSPLFSSSENCQKKGSSQTKTSPEFTHLCNFSRDDILYPDADGSSFICGCIHPKLYLCGNECRDHFSPSEGGTISLELAGPTWEGNPPTTPKVAHSRLFQFFFLFQLFFSFDSAVGEQDGTGSRN